MIEDAKSILRTWGSQDPNFLLCNSKLTFQMTMNPEKTQYLTQGPDGVRRLKEGPSIQTYRGLKIINSRSFSMEDGAPPRDVLRRRIRVAEYYRIPYEEDIEKKFFAFYDESKDAWQKYSWQDLFSMSHIGEVDEKNMVNGRVQFDDENMDYEDDGCDDDSYMSKKFKKIPTKMPKHTVTKPVDFMITRNFWDMMGTWSMQNNERERVADIHDPVNELSRSVNRYNPFGKRVDYTTDVQKRLKVKEACGLRMDMFDANGNPKGGADSAEHAHTHKEYIKNFSRYFKGWLIGNNVPYEVQAFLENYNWQGFAEDKSGMQEAIQRGVIFEELIGRIYNVRKDKIGVDFDDDKGEFEPIVEDRWELVVVRPNIEHNMLGIVMGRGGLEDLGATFWGQTELSCFDDSMHGKHIFHH